MQRKASVLGVLDVGFQIRDLFLSRMQRMSASRPSFRIASPTRDVVWRPVSLIRCPSVARQFSGQGRAFLQPPGQGFDKSAIALFSRRLGRRLGFIRQWWRCRQPEPNKQGQRLAGNLLLAFQPFQCAREAVEAPDDGGFGLVRTVGRQEARHSGLDYL